MFSLTLGLALPVGDTAVGVKMKKFTYLFLLLLSSLQGLKSQQTPNLPKFKAVFLYTFTRYFEWGSGPSEPEFRFALLGADSALVREMQKLADVKQAKGKKIKILVLPASTSLKDLPDAEVLYVNKKTVPDFRIDKSKKNTLVVSDNEPDIYNTMIAFVTADGKQKFAFNTLNTKAAGLRYEADFLQLPRYVVSSNSDSQKKASWEDLVHKLNDSNFFEGVSLSGEEAALVGTKLAEQTKTIQDQKSEIDQQLLSIRSQSEKIKLQERKLELTIQQNNLQELELKQKMRETQAQQLRLSEQEQVLGTQEADIKAHEKKIIKQLEQIDSQKTVIMSAVLTAAAIGLLLVVLYRSFSRAKKTNVILEEQKTLIGIQKQLVEEKHREITDSIHYAERIQKSFLATKEVLDANLKEYFVLFRPKDVVSGDFYWAKELKNGHFAIVTADSTGHGVPGAIMSILNITSLEKATEVHSEPADILNVTRQHIIDRLKKDGSPEGGQDGMDCSVVALSPDGKKLKYSGAYNPIIIVRAGGDGEKLIEIDGDKLPVGKHEKDAHPFTQHEVQLNKGDVVYALTDGFPDQFGGPKGKKFMYRRLKDLLLSVSSLPMEEQKKRLESELQDWMGGYEQVDDITLVGIRV